MQTVIVDKVASVAIDADIGKELRIDDNIPAEEGVLIAVEILNNKARYNTLELTSGRMAALKRGDVIVGALGHRKALFGYSGHLPESVTPGDELQILNLGGVVGICDSVNPTQGPPFNCRVLGVVLEFPFLGERVGRPARTGSRELQDPAPSVDTTVPVLAIAGTCMNSGKTAAAAAIISRLTHNGLKIDAFKATGVALRRDILAMQDAGARNVEIFSDYGIVCTTVENASTLTRHLLNSLSANKPDAIVFELGDGLLGAYGVEAILSDESVRAALSGVVLCANDPVGAWGGVEILRNGFDIDPIAVTGPATDNQVGIDILAQRCNVPAINAMTHAAELGDLLQGKLGLVRSELRKASQ